MPTENRSSNTEMVSVPREWLNSVALLQMPLDELQEQAIQHLCEPCDEPAPQAHPEPIAWMVGTAIWWTKEEAERDAAATGLPIVGLGPMADTAPAEQHHGKPVAWRGINELGEVVTEWIDGVPPSSMVDLCGNPASFASIEQAYTHADPGEVEQHIARRMEMAEQKTELHRQIETLRARLDERDALLREIQRCGLDAICIDGPSIRDRLGAALSASAEPSAAVERHGRAEVKPDAWRASINGNWEYFRSYEQALKELREWQSDYLPEELEEAKADGLCEPEPVYSRAARGRKP